MSIPQHLYGDVIGKYRRYIGMKQYAVAVTIGCTQQNISDCEHRPLLSEKKFEQLIEAMEVNKKDIIDFYENRYGNNREDESEED